MDHSERMGVQLRLSPHSFIFDSRRKGGCLASREFQRPSPRLLGDAPGANTWIVNADLHIRVVGVALRRGCLRPHI